jgi:hypothetical protein
MTMRTARTTICGRCYHGIAPHSRIAAAGLGHPEDGGPCRSAPLGPDGKLHPCDCPVPEANWFQELSDEERTAHIMTNALRRA